ncbi:MAG: FAD:protein FMN transferase [Gemmatimonadota bacterium]|nr:FAD:protein FMN transferase [Gemmatimonadota bacterium]
MNSDKGNSVNGSRRKFLALGAGALVLSVTPWRKRNGPELFRRRIPVMGTVGEIAVVDTDARRAYAAIDAARQELVWVEQTMTRFTAESDIGRVNAAGDSRPVEVTRATGQVVQHALEMAYATDGRFDPALGRASVLWDVTNRTTPPPQREVRRLADRDFFRSVDVTTSLHGAVIRLSDRDVELDLGGIAKGYGVDRAVERLREHGVVNGLVNVGGDLVAMGRSENRDPWRVGVRDPFNPAEVLEVFEAEDVAVATSGDYLRFFTHDGKRYHHLLDPSTGAPVESVRRSATVLASTCMVADACATAVFGLDDHNAKRLAAGAGADLRVLS